MQEGAEKVLLGHSYWEVEKRFTKIDRLTNSTKIMDQKMKSLFETDFMFIRQMKFQKSWLEKKFFF